MSKTPIGKLERVDLREVWENESRLARAGFETITLRRILKYEHRHI